MTDKAVEGLARELKDIYRQAQLEYTDECMTLNCQQTAEESIRRGYFAVARHVHSLIVRGKVEEGNYYLVESEKYNSVSALINNTATIPIEVVDNRIAELERGEG